jgi:hypothetical protein
MLASISGGKVAGLVAAAGVKVTNPNFAYSADRVTAWRPRASRITGAAVPATGIDPAIRVYSSTGICLA